MWLRHTSGKPRKGMKRNAPFQTSATPLNIEGSSFCPGIDPRDISACLFQVHDGRGHKMAATWWPSQTVKPATKLLLQLTFSHTVKIVCCDGSYCQSIVFKNLHSLLNLQWWILVGNPPPPTWHIGRHLERCWQGPSHPWAPSHHTLCFILLRKKLYCFSRNLPKMTSKKP